MTLIFSYEQSSWVRGENTSLLVHEVYEAPKHEISDGDLIQLVKKDANKIGIDLNDDEIEKIEERRLQESCKTQSQTYSISISDRNETET